MSIKYRTRGLSFPGIDAIEVERETEHCVWINGRKSNKVGSWENYHDTWEQAHAFLLAEAQAALDIARNRLQQAQDTYGNVKGMNPPKENT
jgi:hypothetical protein